MAGRPVATSSPPPSSSGGRHRRAVLVATLAVSAVAIIAGLAITFGGLGGPDGTASTPGSTTADAAATSAYADLSLVPVVASELPAPSFTPTGSINATGAAEPSASTTAAAGDGIKAKRIRIERLDIDLRIVEGDGIDAPIDKAAHYPGSAWPGAGSNVYIYGHARKGMFINLWKAQVGDVIELDLADGTARRYVVDEVIPKVPWDAMKYVRPTKTEQLTLQTSTSYHPTSPRFIVIAHPAP